jgi:DNA-binding transcriptional ArsR family regulator
VTVTEIYVHLRLEQSVASQHLAILRKAGIVKTERDGKFIYYSVNHKRVEEINNVATELSAG